MREIPAALAAHLAEGATTLCRAWRLTRRDGTALGFTDHDRDLVFDGTIFAARTGLEAAEANQELGFAVGGGEVAGALVSAGLTEADIAAGRYDDAKVESWIVNWAEPEARAAGPFGGRAGAATRIRPSRRQNWSISRGTLSCRARVRRRRSSRLRSSSASSTARASMAAPPPGPAAWLGRAGGRSGSMRLS
jgi:hypothetical protein